MSTRRTVFWQLVGQLEYDEINLTTDDAFWYERHVSADL